MNYGVVQESKQAVSGALLNMKGESTKLREVNNTIRQFHSQLRKDVLKEGPPGQTGSPTRSDSFNELCTLVDDIDSVSRRIKQEVQQQKVAVADIIDAASSTVGTLLLVRRQQIDEEAKRRSDLDLQKSTSDSGPTSLYRSSSKKRRTGV